MFGEINYNLIPFNICYLIAKNVKSKHKLTEQNYNRLTVFVGIYIISLLYHGMATIRIFVFIIELMIIIMTKRMYWLIHVISMTLLYINVMVIISASGLSIVYFNVYFKMRFDKLHDQIKSIIQNKMKFIT